jgi:AraC-like DNA-binding protein
MSEGTVSAGFVKALIDFAVDKGASEALLLARAGLRGDELADQDARVPLLSYITLMRAGKQLCNDPALALEFGAATDARRFSVVGLIAHSAATMAEALAQLNRYGRLMIEVDLGEGPRFQIIRTETERWLVDRRINPDEFPEITEATFSRLICMTRRLWPHATFALSVEVTHQAPAHRDTYERLWRVPVRFGAQRNAIQTTLDWGEAPVEPDSRYVFGVLTERGDALLKELENSKTVRGQVESLLLPILHTGDVGVDVIAKRLNVSRQTLYRNLKAEGVTFEQTLDDLRRRMALHYLSGKRVSVNETAYLVGFSDATAFSRAFKRWTGMSPREMLQAK